MEDVRRPVHHLCRCTAHSPRPTAIAAGVPMQPGGRAQERGVQHEREIGPGSCQDVAEGSGRAACVTSETPGGISNHHHHHHHNRVDTYVAWRGEEGKKGGRGRATGHVHQEKSDGR